MKPLPLFLLPLLALSLSLLHAQVTITATAPPVLPGKATTLTVTLSGASQVSGVQWTTTPPTGWTLGPQVLSSAVSATPKTLSCSTGPAFLCLVWGLNVLPVPTGVLVTAPLTVPATTVPGSFTVALNGTFAGDLGGVTVAASGVSAIVTVLSPFDLNSDGQVTAADVTAMVNQVVGGNCVADPLGNGTCNILQVIAEVRGWIAAGSRP